MLWAMHPRDLKSVACSGVVGQALRNRVAAHISRSVLRPIHVDIPETHVSLLARILAREAFETPGANERRRLKGVNGSLGSRLAPIGNLLRSSLSYEANY